MRAGICATVWFLLLPIVLACAPRAAPAPKPPRLAKGQAPYTLPRELIAVRESMLKPQYQYVVVIDAGHGGHDKGTYSSKAPKYQEKYLTLTTGLIIKSYLEKMGYHVMLTRSNDLFVPLEERAAFANEQRAHLFVSIHFNSAPNKLAEGIEIFYYRSKEQAKRTKESKALADIVLKRMIAATAASSRGVKAGDLAVIRQTKMAAILIEGGFLTNEEEVYKLKDASYLKKLALGIAQGIHEYVTSG
jgi:N-acetylmuramoyl-L-alanine amidase